MHENLDREEETEWFSNFSLGITFASIFLITGILLIIVGSFGGWLFLACSILFLIITLKIPTILNINKRKSQTNLIVMVVNLQEKTKLITKITSNQNKNNRSSL